MVLFSTTKAHIEGGPQDTLKNIEETGEFVVNIPIFQLKEVMNLTSASLPHGANEFAFAKIEHESSQLVKVPRIKESPSHLECKYYESIQLPVEAETHINRMMFGEIIGINVR